MLTVYFDLAGRRIRALRDGSAEFLFDGFTNTLSETGYATITARRYLHTCGSVSELEVLETMMPRKLRSGLSRRPTHCSSRSIAYHNAEWNILAMVYLRGLRAWDSA
jgi:hypothetical protein